jgi:anti-sigma B factor antagonist
MNLADIQLSTEGSVVIAAITGELDISNVNGIEQAVLVATSNQVELVLMDLSEVEYLDSAGIHLVYRLREKLQSRGQSLRLILPEDSPAADALRLAGVMNHLEIRPTVEAGLE